MNSHNERHWKTCPCPECQHARDLKVKRWVIVGLVILGAVLAGLFSSGCAGTVTPDPVHPQQASWDGNEQNSGILRVAPGGFLVTPHFRDRYNGLIDAYGKTYSPALEHDDGVTRASDGNFVIDAQHMMLFVEMNIKRKSGRTP